MRIGRREFLYSCGGCLAAVAGAGLISPLRASLDRTPGEDIPDHEAQFWEPRESLRVQCTLCPRGCRVDDLERGYCGVRENKGGKYVTRVYGAACAVNVDPIEKKPFFHFLPGTKAFSLATAGCNIDCAFCQNWEISQTRPEQVDVYHLPPRETASAAMQSGSRSVAFTYTEPVVFYEYMYDTALAARERGLRAVMVSNGYIQEKPLTRLCGALDAIKVDLKSFREKYYKEVCAGELAPVLDALKTIHGSGTWLEIVYLMVPTLNDSAAEITELCGWVRENLGPDVPLHFTRFHPMYRLTRLPSTPAASLERALKIGREAGLHYVYLGNLPGHPSESTLCPSCGAVVVRRVGYAVLETAIEDDRCKACGKPVAGVWT